MNAFSLHEYLLSSEYVKFGVPVGEVQAGMVKIQFIISSKEGIFKDRTCPLGNDLLKLTIMRYDSKMTNLRILVDGR